MLPAVAARRPGPPDPRRRPRLTATRLVRHALLAAVAAMLGATTLLAQAGAAPEAARPEGAANGAAPAQGTRWYRGNTHAHTTNSDGNMPPAHVARWYRDNGYDFLVITDHEHVTDVAPLNAALGGNGRFIVMSGEEVTQQIDDPAHPDKRRQAHLVAIGLDSAILPLGERRIATGITIADAYDRNVKAVKAAGAVAQVNHPNFRWSVTPDDMAGLPDSTLFEVWNGHPWVNNLGGTDARGQRSLSTEALWDTLLTRGTLLFGVASDDSHAFRPEDFANPDATRPGLAWVMVRADTLSAPAIMAALRAGRFYSTTGITLADYRADAKEVVLQFAPPAGPGDDRRYLTRFIGRGGRVLAEVSGPFARYAVRGNEGYVRASVTDSNGRRLWTQPIWTRRN